MSKERFFDKVPKEFSNDDFYYLCKAFIDVALNADKYITPDGVVAGKFHLEEMQKASELVKEYLEKHNVDVELLKRAIRCYAHESIDDDDNRQKAFYDQNTRNGNMPAYQVGTVYLFTEVPAKVMDEIFKQALA